MKFFLNSNTESYLRSLADELGESTNAVRVELNRLTHAGLLVSKPNGRTITYSANEQHPLFKDIHSVVRKYIGIDQLIEQVVSKLGSIEFAFITGDYARGIDSGVIDIVIVGTVDNHYLQNLIIKTERIIQRRIRSLVFDAEEYLNYKGKLFTGPVVIIWGEENLIQI